MLRTFAGRCCWTVFLCGCLSGIFAAQPQAFSGPPASASETKYQINGAVVNSVTGEPIRRALVQIFAGEERSLLTDGSGQFEFDNLLAGQTTINVRKPGYFDEREVHPSSNTQAMVTIGPDSQPLLLKLVPEGVISGRIQNTEGEPIESFPVNLITAHIRDGRKQWEQAASQNTNEDGEFRIANLLPGVYYLEVGPGQPPRELDPAKLSAHSYPALFYPGTPDLSSATPLEVGPGQPVNADVSVRPARFFKISGVVEGSVPDQGAGLQIMDHLGNNVSLDMRFDSDTGEFQTIIPGGSYTAVANSQDAGGTQLSAQTSLNVTSDISGIRLMLAPVSNVPINVRTEATRPNQVRATRVSPPVPMLRLIETSRLLTQTYAAGPEGDPRKPFFVLRNLSPGKYLVEVNANAPWYVQSAQCGDTDVLRDELTVSAGAQTPPIDIVLRDDGAELGVEASKSAAGAQATVVLVPDRGSLIRAERGFVGSGTLEFQNLAPGGYSVFAFDRDEIEYKNPDVLDRYMSKAVHITLEPNEQRKIDVELTSVSN